jgi:hypothetical protein
VEVLSFFNQFIKAALLDNVSVLKYENLIKSPDGIKPVGDVGHGLSAKQIHDVFHNGFFCQVVYCRCGFVEYDKFRVNRIIGASRFPDSARLFVQACLVLSCRRPCRGALCDNQTEIEINQILQKY